MVGDLVGKALDWGGGLLGLERRLADLLDLVRTMLRVEATLVKGVALEVVSFMSERNG